MKYNSSKRKIGHHSFIIMLIGSQESGAWSESELAWTCKQFRTWFTAITIRCNLPPWYFLSFVPHYLSRIHSCQSLSLWIEMELQKQIYMRQLIELYRLDVVIFRFQISTIQFYSNISMMRWWVYLRTASKLPPFYHLQYPKLGQ